MTLINVTFLSESLIPGALHLDDLCLGGLWSASAYRREIESPNSDLIAIIGSSVVHPSPPQAPPSSPLPATPSVTLSALGMGCSWAIVDEAHITLLAVHPAIQRRGLGRLLLWSLLYCAHRRGMKRATLEVRISNKGAIALYKQFGFKAAGTRKKYYRDTGEDALILWLSGLQHPSFPTALDQWRESIDASLSRNGWHIRDITKAITNQDIVT